MARRAGRPRPRPTTERRLEPNRERCWSCGGVLWVAYHNRRRLTLLDEANFIGAPLERVITVQDLACFAAV